MSLIYDRRKERGSAPVVHALVIGVDEYAMPGMSLRTSVRSAAAIANWLQTHDLTVPLGTCRALLSPLPHNGELRAEGPPSPATVDELLRVASEWREDASSNRDNIALFYFCGHGFQRSATEDLMLFSDFGSGIGPALRGAVSVDNLFHGMAPAAGSASVARTQLYFIDASRTHERQERFQLSRPTMIFDEFGSAPDDRSAVIFYATSPGQHAFATIGEPSAFAIALLRCLDGEAAVPIDNSVARWGVTVNSLIQGVQKIMASTPGRERGQVPVVGGLVRDHVIRRLESPPLTEVIVNIGNASVSSELTVENPNGEVVYSAVVDPGGRAQFQVPSGLYAIRAKSSDGAFHTSTITSAMPPSLEISLEMKA